MAAKLLDPEPISIGGKKVGPGNPTYVIAEMSANHNQSIDEAIRLVHVAKGPHKDVKASKKNDPHFSIKSLDDLGGILEP